MSLGISDIKALGAIVKIVDLMDTLSANKQLFKSNLKDFQETIASLEKAQADLETKKSEIAELLAKAETKEKSVIAKTTALEKKEKINEDKIASAEAKTREAQNKIAKSEEAIQLATQANKRNLDIQANNERLQKVIQGKEEELEAREAALMAKEKKIKAALV